MVLTVEHLRRCCPEIWMEHGFLANDRVSAVYPSVFDLLKEVVLQKEDDGGITVTNIKVQENQFEIQNNMF